MKKVVKTALLPRSDIGAPAAVPDPRIARRPVVISRRNCAVCRHEQRPAIDLALARRVGLRTISSTFGPSASALGRHGRSCVPAKLAAANVDRVEQVTASTLLDSMVALQEKTQAQLDSAISSKHKPETVAKLIKETRENVGMLGRLLGAFAGENAKSVDNRVQVLALKEMSVGELRDLATALRSK